VFLTFHAIPKGQRRGGWVASQLNEYGGRKEWVLQHIKVLELFLQHAESHWNTEYLSHHRLENFEQCLLIMAKVLGFTKVTRGVIGRLARQVATMDDPTMEGLLEYARVQKDSNGRKFTAGDIVEWAMTLEEFEHDDTLTSTRRLGRYIKAHQYDIQEATGIRIHERRGNRALYYIGDQND